MNSEVFRLIEELELIRRNANGTNSDEMELLAYITASNIVAELKDKYYLKSIKRSMIKIFLILSAPIWILPYILIKRNDYM